MSESNLSKTHKNFIEKIEDCTACIFLINETLLILNDKRETLEEKMIKKDYQRISVELTRIIEWLHGRSLSNLPCPTEILQSLEMILLDFKRAGGEFLKIAQYDLNFLEQYYEFDYNNKLINEYQFPIRLEKLIMEIERA